MGVVHGGAAAARLGADEQFVQQQQQVPRKVRLRGMVRASTRWVVKGG